MNSSSGGPADVRRRLRVAVVALVMVWTVVLAVAIAVATGRFGTMGLPTDGEGRPRGVLVIGAAAGAAALAAAVAYRRVAGPAGDLLRAADQVAAGRYGEVDVAVHGPRELRRLAAAFNEMAAQLAADDEQRRRFLAEVTHELRNPLAILQSQIEAQLDGVHPRDDRHLASLLDEARRLGRLVDDLHTLALTEAGHLVLARQLVQLEELAGEVVARYAAPAAHRDVRLRAALDGELPKVWIDPARIRQVLDNVLANAIRHTPPGGEVAVRVTAAGGTVVCEVVDSGPGFPAGQVDTVFDRFTGSGDSRGSGLGLSIARDLVEAHGGAIAAGNRAERGGAIVRVALPVASSDAP